MKGKKIWGIELSLVRDAPIGRIPKGLRPENRMITFDVQLAQRTSGNPIKQEGRFFISSKELHARLDKGQAERMRGMMGTNLGIMQYIVEEKRRCIRTMLISPFEYAPGRITHPLSTAKSTDAFANLGLVTRMEQRIEEFLHRSYPGFTIQSASKVSPSRFLQLFKRKRNIGEPIPLKEAIRLSRAHARNNYQKNHIKSPLRPKRK
ncbi:MAG: hypothetical protein IPJ89_03435 [Candidatus Iainarchaeum archaeon]|uniref:Uncharacterized protein n=1 Tax=Candidatus Iainarchaeum sp. TaxID=3101447 RepID=A0A7T9DIZ5_9ARCH|nr:MAG: hypothetical protein IPJ89_03435 [Candidatus Diapherotrites archaeon]